MVLPSPPKQLSRRAERLSKEAGRRRAPDPPSFRFSAKTVAAVDRGTSPCVVVLDATTSQQGAAEQPRQSSPPQAQSTSRALKFEDTPGIGTAQPPPHETEGGGGSLGIASPPPSFVQVTRKLNGEYTEAIATQYAMSIKRSIQHETAAITGMELGDIVVDDVFVEGETALVFILSLRTDLPRAERLRSKLHSFAFPASQMYLQDLFAESRGDVLVGEQQQQQVKPQEDTELKHLSVDKKANPRKAKGHKKRKRGKGAKGPRREDDEDDEDDDSSNESRSSSDSHPSAQHRSKPLHDGAAVVPTIPISMVAQRSLNRAASVSSSVVSRRRWVTIQKPPWVSPLDDVKSATVNDDGPRDPYGTRSGNCSEQPSPQPRRFVEPDEPHVVLLEETPEPHHREPLAAVHSDAAAVVVHEPILVHVQHDGMDDHAKEKKMESEFREHSFSHAIGDGFLLVDCFQNSRQSGEVSQLELFFEGSPSTLTVRQVREYIAEHFKKSPSAIALLHNQVEVKDEQVGRDLRWSNGSLVEALLLEEAGARPQEGRIQWLDSGRVSSLSSSRASTVETPRKKAAAHKKTKKKRKKKSGKRKGGPSEQDEIVSTSTVSTFPPLPIPAPPPAKAPHFAAVHRSEEPIARAQNCTPKPQTRSDAEEEEDDPNPMPLSYQVFPHSELSRPSALNGADTHGISIRPPSLSLSQRSSAHQQHLIQRVKSTSLHTPNSFDKSTSEDPEPEVAPFPCR